MQIGIGAMLGAAIFASLMASAPAAAQSGDMSFFVTSVGAGDGANLGGLEGADAHCQMLADAAGAGAKEWRAYLSTDTVNARDRIGSGPWYNATGVLIAENVDALHADDVNINKETALSEAGAIINGRGDDPNMHDILTGSNRDGTSSGATCENWTSNADDGSATVGHHDLIGNPQGINYWNFSHGSRGCSQQALVGTGGAGLLYCFAAN